MATVLIQPNPSVAVGRNSVEISLSKSLSLKLVKVNQKRSYIYPTTQKRVRYSAVKYRFDDLPRPNHGLTLEQLEEVTNKLVRIVAYEKMKQQEIKQ